VSVIRFFKKNNSKRGLVCGGGLCNAPKKHKNRFSVTLTERRFFL